MSHRALASAMSLLLLIVAACLRLGILHRPRRRFRRRPVTIPTILPLRRGRKPDWVGKEVLRLRALMPEVGIRSLAHSFNRLHGPAMTVGKTYVSETLKRRAYELLCIARELRNSSPRAVPINAVWALDFTYPSPQPQAVLGVLDHGSRRCLVLTRLANKSAWTLLGHLCLAIGRYGKSRTIRTDNEPVFTSGLWRIALRLAGIRHQRTKLCSPWQNGRIERFFGSLKAFLHRSASPETHWTLQCRLEAFAWFYNHVRPHQNLAGRTPAEAWHGIDIFSEKCQPRRALYLSALGGRLAGFYIRRR